MSEFAVLDLTQASFTNGMCFRAQTDTPCHLTLYWTTTRPLRHRTTRTFRGETFPWGAYFCFTGYQLIEQEEPGDTLFHTFPLSALTPPPIVYCVLAGTVAGTPSPSRSPIFSITYPGLDVLYNNDWRSWPLGDPYPLFWDWYVVGTGWSRWHRETTGCLFAPINPLLEAGGTDRGTGLRQTRSALNLRSQHIEVYAWANGFANSNTRLSVRTDGTGGWYKHDSLGVPSVWELLDVDGIVPPDATTLTVEVQNWTDGMGPTFTRFDLITVYLP